MYKAGFVSFGEVNTPRDMVDKKTNDAKQLLIKNGFKLVTTDSVTDEEKGIEAERAISDLKKEEFDFLIVCLTGWIPSHTVIRVISEFKEKPMILWGLAGNSEDGNGRLATTAAQAGTTAIRKPMEDMGYKFKYIYDFPDAQPKIDKIITFARAASTVVKLKRSKVGMMGYRDMRLYGTMFDGVSLRAKIGTEVEFFEMLEIVQRMENVDEGKVNRLAEKILKEWDFQKEPNSDFLKFGVKAYLAIKEKIEEGGYDAISLIDVDGMKKLLKFPPSLIFMLIANEMKKYTIPENDTLGAVTQLITGYATGQISAYMEFYEFMPDRVLIGVPDYVPIEVIDGPLKVLPTSFGQLSEGILNISKVKTGKVTLARLGYSDNDYIMHVVTGMVVEPRSWEEVGWEPPAPQLPSLEVILDTPVDDFAQQVMGQHYIVTYGDNTEVLKDICKLMDIEMI
jgi:L-fucose isomerase-like protein